MNRKATKQLKERVAKIQATVVLAPVQIKQPIKMVTERLPVTNFTPGTTLPDKLKTAIGVALGTKQHSSAPGLYSFGYKD